MNIRIVRTVEEFAKLKKDWDLIGSSIAYKFDWLFVWWEQFHENNELSILVVEDNGKVIGIAPIYIKTERLMKFFKIRKLSFLGGGLSDNLDFFVHQAYDSEKVFKGLFAYIFSNLQFDTIELNQVCSFGPNFHLWQKYCANYGFKTEEDLVCQRVKLSDYSSYDEYYEKNLSKSHKTSIKYRNNKVLKSGRTVEYVIKNDITEDEFKKLANVNISRQRYLMNKGDSNRYCYFIDDKKYNFLKNYFCNANPKDVMLAYAVCDGEMTAYMLYLINDKTLYYWNTGFNIEYDMFAPTKLLINETLKWAFENNYECIDFILGSETYKSHWANEITPTYTYKKKKTVKSNFLDEFRKIVPAFLQTKYNDLDIMKLKNPDFQID